MFLVADPKRYYSKDETFKYPTLGHPHMFNAIKDVLFGEGLFRPDKDLLVLFDGRSLKSASYIRDVARAAAKTKHISQRGPAQLRLLHHNADIPHDRKSRAVVSSSSMDPLETAYLFLGAQRAQALPLRDRKWVDLPGTNEVKGWSNLGLRSAACVQANQVSRETKAAIFSGISFATVAAQKLDTLDFDNGGGDDRKPFLQNFSTSTALRKRTTSSWTSPPAQGSLVWLLPGQLGHTTASLTTTPMVS